MTETEGETGGLAGKLISKVYKRFIISFTISKHKKERMACFAKCGEKEVETAKITKYSTNTCVTVFNTWVEARGFVRKRIYEYDSEELNNCFPTNTNV